jgi:hypothetical protein
MTIVNVVDCGAVIKYNGLHMKRAVFMPACFTPQCFANEANDGFTPESQILVRFEQWIEDANGDKIPELTSQMNYVLKNEIASEDLPSPRLFVSEFLNNLWEVTVAKPYGFRQQIELTLSKLPHEFKDCEQVKSIWFND